MDCHEIFSQLTLFCVIPIKPENEKKKYLTKVEKSAFALPQNLKDILVGLILGDIQIEKRVNNANACLRFGQGTIHKDYLYHLYDLFQNFCPSGPKISNNLPHKITGKVYSRIRFHTYSLPCFNALLTLFYPDGVVKIVPMNIAEVLTPLSLAYWLCDDGTFHKTDQAVTLCTNGFTKAEVEHLAKSLNDKWQLKYTLSYNKGHQIRIAKKSLPILQTLLKDVMPPMMLHKIGL
uniref:LAGLIDADG endonuclease family protein n=1 Tax=Rhizoctonia solani TaxID=456999 RepID=N0A547_9AGAM|nr:LAGLIDADG endonuclease family protein [Rhizoctonia solani]AGK45370.1 LAGLIDADG endonuclease family protein [Rhizoctonia solani]